MFKAELFIIPQTNSAFSFVLFGSRQSYSSNCKPLKTSCILLCLIPDIWHISQSYIQTIYLIWLMLTTPTATTESNTPKSLLWIIAISFKPISLLCPNFPCRHFSTQQPGDFHSDHVTPLHHILSSFRVPYNHLQGPLWSNSPRIPYALPNLVQLHLWLHLFIFPHFSCHGRHIGFIAVPQIYKKFSQFRAFAPVGLCDKNVLPWDVHLACSLVFWDLS